MPTPSQPPLAPAWPSIQRIEEASLNAWPARHSLLLDGWQVRFANGFTRRANCVVPLYASAASEATLAARIRYCENLYAREQLHTLFRLTSEPSNRMLDAVLEDRGYRKVDDTLVQVVALQATPAAAGAALHLVPPDRWLATYQRFAAMSDSNAALHAALLRRIRTECAYAVLSHDDAPVACALGVLEQPLLGIYDLVTDATRRGSGHGRALAAALLAWGRRAGARHAYLQVVADNQAALRLYRGLGFQNRYRYWYRQAP